MKCLSLNRREEAKTLALSSLHVLNYFGTIFVHTHTHTHTHTHSNQAVTCLYARKLQNNIKHANKTSCPLLSLLSAPVAHT
jgi:hypothetical protein